MQINTETLDRKTNKQKIKDDDDDDDDNNSILNNSIQFFN
jgi:hypothetical protein